eukprot:2994988-Rhodomonas_salina.2
MGAAGRKPVFISALIACRSFGLRPAVTVTRRRPATGHPAGRRQISSCPAKAGGSAAGMAAWPQRPD